MNTQTKIALNPVQSGDTALYWLNVGGSDHLIRGIVAERMTSVLTGRDRVRIVDSAREMDDPDAGRWQYVEDLHAAYPPGCDPAE